MQVDHCREALKNRCAPWTYEVIFAITHDKRSLVTVRYLYLMSHRTVSCILLAGVCFDGSMIDWRQSPGRQDLKEYIIESNGVEETTIEGVISNL